MTSTEIPPTATGRAVGLMIAASVCYAAMGAFVKVAARDLSAFTVVFGRSVVIVVIVGAMMARRGVPARWVNRRAMFWRCATGVTAVCLYFYALSAIPLASAVTLQWTSPLFVALAGWLLLGEKVSRGMLACIFTAMAGAVIIVSPDPSALEVDALAALGSAVLAGFAYAFVRELRTTDHPESIVFWFSVLAVVVSAPSLLFLDRWLSLVEVGALLGVGVTGMGGQLLMTWAMRFGEAAFVSTFSYATVLFSAVVGFFVFDETLTAPMAIGALLIVGSGVALSWLKHRTEIGEQG